MYPESLTPKEGTKALQGQPRSGVPGGEVLQPGSSRARAHSNLCKNDSAA